MSTNALTLNPAGQDLTRAQWQHEIFREPLGRMAILSLTHRFPVREVRLRVHRNQPFEFIAATVQPFLAYAGYTAQIDYSDYDDSLTFLPGRPPADVELIWLDFARYRNQEALGEWLAGRIADLRSHSSAPILVANRAGDDADAARFNQTLAEIAAAAAGVYVCDLTGVLRQLGPAYYDSRAQKIAATALSSTACLELSRMFGLVWLPAVLGRRIKAILVDLDNTLYEGVLGEDGAGGVKLTDAHAAFQQAVLACRERGIFLGMVSRNEPADVENLFRQRPDFPLRPEHFSSVSISWRPKPDAIREAAAKLRIGLDTVLFIDDNPGELMAVAGEIPAIWMLHAAGPAETTRALSLYPGLAGVPRSAADELRMADLAAEETRAKLRENTDPGAYFRSLGMQLSFYFNPATLAGRLHELSNKTNQFNTGFLRLTEAEVARRLHDPAAAAVAVGLRDRLSDSGIIAALFLHWSGDTLVADEIVISCRALGRQVESIIVAEAVRGVAALSERVPKTIRFHFVEGPRNQPARDWLQRYTGVVLEGELPIEVAWSVEDPALNLQGAIDIEWKKQ